MRVTEKLSDDQVAEISGKIKPHVLAGEIQFGWGADKLSEQLGYTDNHIEHLQKDADAIGRLTVRSVIPPSVSAKARNKIAKRIFSHMIEIGALAEREAEA